MCSIIKFNLIYRYFRNSTNKSKIFLVSHILVSRDCNKYINSRLQSACPRSFLIVSTSQNFIVNLYLQNLKILWNSCIIICINFTTPFMEALVIKSSVRVFLTSIFNLLPVNYSRVSSTI